MVDIKKQARYIEACPKKYQKVCLFPIMLVEDLMYKWRLWEFEDLLNTHP